MKKDDFEPRRDLSIDEQLAPVALGTVSRDDPEQGLERLTRGGGGGRMDKDCDEEGPYMWV